MAIDPAELQALPPLRSFSPDDIRELVSLGHEVTLRPGEVVMEPQTPAHEAILLVSGRLSVSVEGAGGRERNVGDVWPGEIVGESAFFEGSGKRTARVRCIQGGQGLALPSTFMEDARGTRALAVLQAHLIATMAKRIRGTDLAIRKAWQDQVALEKRMAERADKQASQSARVDKPVTLAQRLFGIFGGR